jgi:hypothetical protein
MIVFDFRFLRQGYGFGIDAHSEPSRTLNGTLSVTCGVFGTGTEGFRDEFLAMRVVAVCERVAPLPRNTAAKEAQRHSQNPECWSHDNAILPTDKKHRLVRTRRPKLWLHYSDKRKRYDFNSLIRRRRDSRALLAGGASAKVVNVRTDRATTLNEAGALASLCPPRLHPNGRDASLKDLWLAKDAAGHGTEHASGLIRALKSVEWQCAMAAVRGVQRLHRSQPLHPHVAAA